MIFYNSENSIRDISHFVVHCFVTAMLQSILYPPYSSEAVLRLCYQTLLNIVEIATP